VTRISLVPSAGRLSLHRLRALAVTCGAVRRRTRIARHFEIAIRRSSAESRASATRDGEIILVEVCRVKKNLLEWPFKILALVASNAPCSVVALHHCCDRDRNSNPRRIAPPGALSLLGLKPQPTPAIRLFAAELPACRGLSCRPPARSSPYRPR
jgi:hypothetical protein